MKKIADMNIVWTAVSVVVFTLASFVGAWAGDMFWTIAFGLASLSSATLSSRER